MSQIFKPFTSGSPVPPAVPTQFTADDATIAVPALNNLNLFSNDSTTYNANGISSTASGSTLTYRLNNRVQGTGTTVDAATLDIITFAMGATPGCFHLTVNIAGFRPATPSGAGFTVDVCAFTDGASGTFVDVDIYPQKYSTI